MTAFAGVLVALFFAAAAEPALDCTRNDLPQMGMNMCAYRTFERADAAMNAQWRLTMAAAKEADRTIDRSYDRQPTHTATLLAAQRAWLTYRDQHCLGESFTARGGSMAPMLVSACKASLTETRTKQLRELAETE